MDILPNDVGHGGVDIGSGRGDTDELWRLGVALGHEAFGDLQIGNVDINSLGIGYQLFVEVFSQCVNNIGVDRLCASVSIDLRQSKRKVHLPMSPHRIHSFYVRVQQRKIQAASSRTA